MDADGGLVVHFGEALEGGQLRVVRVEVRIVFVDFGKAFEICDSQKQG